MSAEGDGRTRVPGLVRLGEDSEGRTMLAAPYDGEAAAAAVEHGLAQKTRTEPEPDDTQSETPEPESEGAGRADRDAGPIRRFNDVFTDLGSVQLEAMGLDGHEIANATMTLRNEMYRSEFPIVQPRFTVKCVDEDCHAEYDEEMGFCMQCARRAMKSDGVDVPPTDPDEIPEEYQDFPVRPPNPSEKRDAQRQAESVNKEGQSLRELMQIAEDDQSRLGISTIVAKKMYGVAEGDSMVYDRGEIIYEEVDELVRADPKRLVPVVDENGRVGGHWWTCPVHRRESKTGRVDYEDGHTHCDHCGASLREVFFAEREGAGRYSRESGPDKLYFQGEVVTWARYFPRLHGLDGLSPVHHIWLKQAILHWMDIYGAAFFDPDSERYPNKFMVVHTTNPKAWEKQFEKAEEDAKENPYSEQIMYNEYSGESNSTPEVQVIDLMSDELLGQDQQIKDQYKQDIRTQFGVTNVFDSELSDAGGLNNEGLQMEVTDRSIASAMHDTVAGPLDELAKVLGIDDYIFEFVPPQDTDIEDLRNQIEVGQKAAGAGLDARLEDETLEVSDGEFEEEEGGDEGGLGSLFGDFSDAPDWVSEKAVGDDDWSAETRTFRVVPSDEDDTEYRDDVLGVGVAFPESGVYVDWNLSAFPDELEEPHVSEYGSIGDLQKATNNEIVDLTRPPGAREKADDEGDGAPPAAEDADWRTDGTERTPARDAGEGEATRKRRGPVRFGNVGGDPFEDQESMEAFIGDLEDEGADVLLGDEPWQHASGFHDRPIVAYGIGLGDAEDVWAEHEENAVSATGPSSEDEEGNERRRDGPDEEKLEAVRKLDEAFEHIVWADETTKAEPFWNDDEDVPEFVLEVVEDVIPRSVTEVDIASLPGAIGSRMIDVFQDNLTQPQGWSLRSLTRDISDTFGVPEDDAELVARTESSKILNEAREKGYERAGALGEEGRRFHWKGPQDHRTTDACKWLSQVTGWADGSDAVREFGKPKSVDAVGEPVTYSELIALEKEATEKFFPHLDFRKHVLHPNERYTFSETFKLEHAGAAGPVEVEYKADLSPAMSGTFVSA